MDIQWLKSAQENFEDALEKKDWGTARAVVDDVKDRGFFDDSREMDMELQSHMPSAPHGYILGFLRKKNEEYKAKGLVPTLDLLIEDLTN